jgi:hypothetical protein
MRPLVKAAKLIGRVLLIAVMTVLGINVAVAILVGVYQGAVLLGILLAASVCLFLRTNGRAKKAGTRTAQKLKPNAARQAAQPIRPASAPPPRLEPQPHLVPPFVSPWQQGDTAALSLPPASTPQAAPSSSPARLRG